MIYQKENTKYIDLGQNPIVMTKNVGKENVWCK